MLHTCGHPILAFQECSTFFGHPTREFQECYAPLRIQHIPLHSTSHRSLFTSFYPIPIAHPFSVPSIYLPVAPSSRPVRFRLESCSFLGFEPQTLTSRADLCCRSSPLLLSQQHVHERLAVAFVQHWGFATAFQGASIVSQTTVPGTSATASTVAPCW